MTAESTQDLLVDGLEELYYTEQQLDEALGKLSEQTENESASQAFSEHREETREHIDRLEQVFDAIGAEADTKEDPVVDSLIDEHEQFAQNNEGEVLDRYNISAGQKTEHYEIAAYGNVTSLASRHGHEDAADLLEETLREEEQALDDLSQVGESFDEQQVAGD